MPASIEDIVVVAYEPMRTELLRTSAVQQLVAAGMIVFKSMGIQFEILGHTYEVNELSTPVRWTRADNSPTENATIQAAKDLMEDGFRTHDYCLAGLAVNHFLVLSKEYHFGRSLIQTSSEGEIGFRIFTAYVAVPKLREHEPNFIYPPLT